jgi:hypothetical protein
MDGAMLGSVDATKLQAIMVAGGIFALAGLALLFRPTRGEGEHSAEVLGLKFRFSSAGMVVFLVGAVLLVTPLFVREERRFPMHTNGDVPPTGSGAPDAPGFPPPVRGAEAEPNDHPSQPNQIEVGETYKGTLQDQDADFFVFRADISGELRLVLRCSKPQRLIAIKIFDAHDRELMSGLTDDTLSEAFRLNGSAFYIIRLKLDLGTVADYELTVRSDT